ncbi:MAG: hypothetical protein KC561_08280, partial [Myxococcales bacterium]|nr:hypothetical protein [Myxococcales bacterium]
MSSVPHRLRQALREFELYGRSWADDLRRLRAPWGPTNQPVLIYQMGKVASSSIYKALSPLSGLDVYHIHRIALPNIISVAKLNLRRGLVPRVSPHAGLLRHRLRRAHGCPIYVISMVREPVGRNLSAFFQNVLRSREAADVDASSVERLRSTFLESYSHDVPVTWFDREFRPVIGVDVYDYEFDREAGFARFDSGPYRILLMRHDLGPDEVRAHLEDLLGREDFELGVANRGADKRYGDV